MNIDVKTLAKNIVTEGLAVDSSAPYVYPNPDNEAEVLLQLSLGVAKNNADKLVTGAKLDDKQHAEMITAGKKVISGNLSPESYSKKLQDVLGIKLDDFASNQIAMRLMYSYSKNNNKPAEQKGLKEK